MPAMDNLQFAYLANRSTEDALNTLIHEITQHLDRGSNYARCLFIDYSSAFNTMQPHILIDRLDMYNVPARLQLLVLDFLTNRKQYVKTNLEKSSTITINTGAPQGCVLSAFLFIVYTNAMSLNSKSCKIIKYADDTIVVGLIDKNDETEYRSTIDYVSRWCSENYLALNASKTREMIFDPRKNQNMKNPIIINNTPVQVVDMYKYLGVNIQTDLKWNSHVEMQVNKVSKRMYHVYCLRKLNVDSKIICLFYNSVLSSVLTYASSTWYGACSSYLKDDISKFMKKVSKMIKNKDIKECIENPDSTYDKRCLSTLSKIVHDQTHPLHNYVTILPHGNLNVPYCKTARFQNTVIPAAIKLSAKKHQMDDFMYY